MWRQGRGVWGGALKTEEAEELLALRKTAFLKILLFLKQQKTTHRSQEAVWLCRGRAQTLHLLRSGTELHSDSSLQERLGSPHQLLALVKLGR